jgi:uncharacterized pyridoxal phosphate-containing UPF0001 family protein
MLYKNFQKQKSGLLFKQARYYESLDTLKQAHPLEGKREEHTHYL